MQREMLPRVRHVPLLECEIHEGNLISLSYISKSTQENISWIFFQSKRFCKSYTPCQDIWFACNLSDLIYLLYNLLCCTSLLIISSLLHPLSISESAIWRLSDPPLPLHQAGCHLICWHSLPRQGTFYKTISSGNERIWASKRAINSNQALLWCAEWSSPRVSVILWLSASYAKLPLSAFVRREQYESALGSLRVTCKFLGFNRNVAERKKNSKLIFQHRFFIIWSKYPLFQLRKHISSNQVLSLKRDQN